MLFGKEIKIISLQKIKYDQKNKNKKSITVYFIYLSTLPHYQQFCKLIINIEPHYKCH